MIVHSTFAEPHTIEDLDISFTNGLLMTVTVDEEAGDTVETIPDPHTTIFHITSKPNPMDISSTIPAEDISVFMNHVIAIHHRKRLYVPPSPEQHHELRATMLELSKTIQ